MGILRKVAGILVEIPEQEGTEEKPEKQSGMKDAMRKAASIFVELPSEENDPPEANPASKSNPPSPSPPNVRPAQPPSNSPPPASSVAQSPPATPSPNAVQPSSNTWPPSPLPIKPTPPPGAPPLATINNAQTPAATPPVQVSSPPTPPAAPPPEPVDARAFIEIYRKAGLSLTGFGAEKMLEMLSRLPAELSLEQKQMTVMATLEAMGREIGATPDNIVADAQKKIAALADYVDGVSKETADFVNTTSTEINVLQSQIEAKRKGIEEAQQRKVQATEMCRTEAGRLEGVLKFFKANETP